MSTPASPLGTPSSSSAFSAVSLFSRIARYAPQKALGTTVGMAAFFVAYFFLLRHPLYPPTLVPLTPLDAFINFHPLALAPYVALWPYIALLPALLIDRRELTGFALGCIALAVTGLAIFLVWPTIIPAPDIDWSLHPAVAFLKTADAAGNACPSLHAAFAAFTGLWFARLLPRLGAGPVLQSANILVAVLIVYSTLATKQHVALDALFGSLLGAWAAGLNFISTPTGEDAPVHRRSLFLTVAIIKLSSVLLWYSGVPFGFCLAVFLTGGGFVLFQLFAHGGCELLRVRTRFFPSVPGAREVWLTLDDGPDPADTPRILDLLDQHRARATFFLIGERAARHPGLVSAIRLRGHEIAHHTQTHPCGTFWCASPARLDRELDAPLALLNPAHSAPPPSDPLVIGHSSLVIPCGLSRTSPRLFRAPVGFKNIFLGPALAARGLTCVSWTLRSGDSFACTPAAVAAHVARRVRPGAILLLHEGPPLRTAVRVHALAAVLTTLAAQNYRCVIPSAAALR